jgi:hypothetical protein
VDREVSGDIEEGVRKQLALDTDKTTAIMAACVFVAVCSGLIVEVWQLAFGHLHAIEYLPLRLSAWDTFIPELGEKLVPLFMLWIGISVWKHLDRFQKFTAVLFIFYFWIGAVLSNCESLNHTVLYSLTICAHTVDSVSSVLILVLIIRWFRSIIRYV